MDGDHLIRPIYQYKASICRVSQTYPTSTEKNKPMRLPFTTKTPNPHIQSLFSHQIKTPPPS